MWTLNLAIAYLRFLIHAKPPGAMHSPFLFDLLPHAFDKSKVYYAFRDIERTRYMLGQSDTIIESAEFGAGSRRRKNRSVGEFVRAALSSPRQCEILFRLAEQLKPTVTIELGSAFGISTAYLASAYRNGRVYAFEGNPTMIKTAKRVIGDHGLENVEFIEGDFDQTLPLFLEQIGSVDLAFIDGNHRYEPTLRYFDLICSTASDDAVVIIDDIRWSREMMRSWNALRQDSRIRVSVDAFSFGILFLSSRFKDREHYTIAPGLLKGGPVLG